MSHEKINKKSQSKIKDFNELYDAVDFLPYVDFTDNATTVKKAMFFAKGLISILSRTDNLNISMEEQKKLSNLLILKGACLWENVSENLRMVDTPRKDKISSIHDYIWKKDSLAFPFYVMSGLIGYKDSVNSLISQVVKGDKWQENWGRTWLRNQRELKGDFEKLISFEELYAELSKLPVVNLSKVTTPKKKAFDFAKSFMEIIARTEKIDLNAEQNQKLSDLLISKGACVSEKVSRKFNPSGKDCTYEQLMKKGDTIEFPITIMSEMIRKENLVMPILENASDWSKVWLGNHKKAMDNQKTNNKEISKE